MKKQLLTVILLLVLLLTACDVDDFLIATSGQDNVTIDVPPQGFQIDKAAPDLYYDEICLVEDLTAQPSLIKSGYFTVGQDGQWGLIRADGTELLPCLADQPVAWCGEHWLWNTMQLNGYEQDEYDEQMRQKGESGLCFGHGGRRDEFAFVSDAQTKKPVGYMWNERVEGFDILHPIGEEQIEKYGSLLPITDRELYTSPGDPDLLGEAGTRWAYYDAIAEERIYPPDLYQYVGWFLNESLAPVNFSQEAWAYINTNFVRVTEKAYDAIYGGWNIEGYAGPTLAAYLQNGYAAVRRLDTQNGWGLLDAAGTEIIPAENAGIAWDGVTLWRRTNPLGPWRCYRLF